MLRAKHYRKVYLITTIGFDGRIRVLMDAGRIVKDRTIGETTYYWGDHELWYQGVEFKRRRLASRMLRTLLLEIHYVLLCRIEPVYIINPKIKI